MVLPDGYKRPMFYWFMASVAASWMAAPVKKLSAVLGPRKADAHAKTLLAAAAGTQRNLGVQNGRERLNDGQSQAAARAALIAVHPVEALENLVVFGFRNAGAVILDFDD